MTVSLRALLLSLLSTYCGLSASEAAVCEETEESCSGPFFQLTCRDNVLDVKHCCSSQQGDTSLFSSCLCEDIIVCDGMESRVVVYESGTGLLPNQRYDCLNIHFNTTSRTGNCTLLGSCDYEGDAGSEILPILDQCSFTRGSTDVTVEATAVSWTPTTVSMTPTTATVSEMYIPAISITPTTLAVSETPSVLGTPSVSEMVTHSENTSEILNGDPKLLLILAGAGGGGIVLLGLLLGVSMLSVRLLLRRKELSRSLELHCISESIQEFDPDFHPVKINGPIPRSLSGDSVIHDLLFKVDTELPDHMDSGIGMWDTKSSSEDSYLTL